MDSLQTFAKHVRRRTLSCFIVIGPLVMFSANAATVSGIMTLTSDYVWRGSSQNQGHSSVQAGLKGTTANGLYGAWWGSSVNFSGQANASTELDLVAGWNKDLSSTWNLDVNVTRYTYPGSYPNLNWTEYGSTLTWNNLLWLQTSWSNQALASRTNGTFSQFGLRLPLANTLRVELVAEHYWLSHQYADDYSDGAVSLIWQVTKTISLRATGHMTDHSAKRLFSDQAGSRMELAMQANF